MMMTRALPTTDTAPQNMGVAPVVVIVVAREGTSGLKPLTAVISAKERYPMELHVHRTAAAVQGPAGDVIAATQEDAQQGATIVITTETVLETSAVRVTLGRIGRVRLR